MISNNQNGLIAITNPKILTTINNAEYGAKTLDVELGSYVGYKYKGNNKYNSDTKLLYCTDGILTSQILGSDEYLSAYNCVIIDEAHER